MFNIFAEIFDGIKTSEFNTLLAHSLLRSLLYSVLQKLFLQLLIFCNVLIIYSKYVAEEPSFQRRM